MCVVSWVAIKIVKKDTCMCVYMDVYIQNGQLSTKTCVDLDKYLSEKLNCVPCTWESFVFYRRVGLVIRDFL